MVSYCKIASSNATATTVAAIAAAKPSTPAGIAAVAAAQWSVSNSTKGQPPRTGAPSGPSEANFTKEDIPRLAEYSASLYAKTPEEHASHIQYDF